MAGHQLVYLSRCHGFVESTDFTNKANSYTPKLKIHSRPNLCQFGRYVAKTKQFLSKKCRNGYPAAAFIWKKIHPFYRDLGGKNRDFGNWASTAYYVRHRNFYKEKSGEARFQKPSQPGSPGSYAEALIVCH